MKIKKATSIPLVLHDPYFSIWSSVDHLYDADPVHWSGIKQQMRGYLTVDGTVYAFLGDRGNHDVIPQVSIEVTATATEYVFENDMVILKCCFTSPLLPDDMVLVSRPCTYVDFEVKKKKDCEAGIQFDVSADLVRQSADTVIGYDGKHKEFIYSHMGRAVQLPLGGSDDRNTINWGYVYVATKEDGAQITFDKTNEKIHLDLPLSDGKQSGFILAYDDLVSINYFGQWRRAYWTKEYSSILEAIAAAFSDKASVLTRAKELDKDIETRARELGGDGYAFLCNMSFRQAFSAHKLITDESGEILFLSKENDSNGCIGTVDVSYPSVPLFMLYDTEYVKGMLRPIFKFASCDVWEYDFAPHDLGRYPYAWGQSYGWKPKEGDDLPERGIWESGKSGVYPPFYTYPAGSDNYDLKYQMPVEECGNMLIMTAVVCMADGNPEFARPHWEMLERWKNYLVEFGADPGDQLCTDDFAGHLEHNVNLSVKAIMGIKAYSILAEMLEMKEEAETYRNLAREMAADWEMRAYADDHYTLAFGSADTWSLKYNLVWDKMWGSQLFSDEVYEKELTYYLQQVKEYGIPLDNRTNYTKSDWILWCASMTENKEKIMEMVEPIVRYVENSETRVPFSDWYDAETGRYYHFIARSVQGGLFMPMFFKTNKTK